ncbi:hypothetical protein AOLI_G00253300, partial [Acnodon oligacanthus]
LDKSEVSTLGVPPAASHGGSDGNISVEGVCVGACEGEAQRTRAALEHLQQKILKITEQIRVEQEARDNNVAEYLKLAHNADKQQAARIKQVFEKKNQKSAQTIAHLHKKLEHYHKKLKEIEQNGLARQPKDVLRDMQQGLKDVGANMRAGISGFGGGVVEGVKGGVSALTHTAAVVSKPREFASLIRNKFGSADNIAHLKESLEECQAEETPRALCGSATLVSSPKYGSDDECSSATSGSGAGSNSGGAGAMSGLGAGMGMGSPRLDGHHHHHHHSWDALLEGLQEIKASQAQMEDAMEDMKSQLQSDYSYMTQCLQEERYRYERLEEQLNDLSELHQNELTNLKQELASMEEKVAYQSYERARDIRGSGVVSDSYLQAGASAAAAAGGAAGGSGERQRSGAARKTHQRHPGPHGCAAGVRLHHGQLHHAADEDAHPRGHQRRPHALPHHTLETLGLAGALAAAQLSRPASAGTAVATFTLQR